jgi:hypothetical protein
MPIIVPPITSATRRTWAWIDAAGINHDLSAEPVRVGDGVSGWWMPSVDVVRDALPFGAGSRIRRVRHTERIAHLPLVLQSDTPGAIHALKRDILPWFDPLQGDGYLVCTAPDATARRAACRYLSGLEYDERIDNGGLLAQIAVVELLAASPYWEDAVDQTSTYTRGGSLASWFSGDWFPMRLSAGGVFAEAAINNTGTVEAWPVWTIHGPGVAPVLRNTTTGKYLALNATLAYGDAITVDTRPGALTIRDASGNNLYPLRQAGSTLWPLAKGVNNVRVEMTGYTDDTAVDLSYRRRFLSP